MADFNLKDIRPHITIEFDSECCTFKASGYPKEKDVVFKRTHNFTYQELCSMCNLLIYSLASKRSIFEDPNIDFTIKTLFNENSGEIEYVGTYDINDESEEKNLMSAVVLKRYFEKHNEFSPCIPLPKLQLRIYYNQTDANKCFWSFLDLIEDLRELSDKDFFDEENKKIAVIGFSELFFEATNQKLVTVNDKGIIWKKTSHLFKQYISPLPLTEKSYKSICKKCEKKYNKRKSIRKCIDKANSFNWTPAIHNKVKYKRFKLFIAEIIRMGCAYFYGDGLGLDRFHKERYYTGIDYITRNRECSFEEIVEPTLGDYIANL